MISWTDATLLLIISATNIRCSIQIIVFHPVFLFFVLTTFFSYYGLESCDTKSVNNFLSGLITNACDQLRDSSCLQYDQTDHNQYVLVPTTLGRLASYYYLSHLTMKLFTTTIQSTSSIHDLLRILSVSVGIF